MFALPLSSTITLLAIVFIQGVCMKTRFLLSVGLILLSFENSSAQWTKASETFSDGVRCLVAKDSVLFAGSDNGVLFSSDNASTWSSISPTLLQQSVMSVAFVGTDIFAAANGSGGGKVFRSSDGAKTWSVVYGGWLGQEMWCLLINGSNIYVGTDSGLVLSSNGGTTWTTLNSGLKVPDSYFSAVIDNGILFIGNLHGGIYKSTDKGSTWALANFGVNSVRIFSLTTMGTKLFGGTSVGTGGVYISTDFGVNWTLSNSGLSDPNVTSFAVSGASVFAGTTGGMVFLSTNGGANWVNMNGGSGLPRINSLVVSGGFLFAGTSVGIWRRPLSEMITSVESSKAPLVFSLYQNYPNPFNPSTTLRFDLAKRTYVTLKICDLLGRAVAVLVEGSREPGHYELQWDASSVPSGIYFYRLQAGEYVETKKMIFLK
jgi:hypothetical protein